MIKNKRKASERIDVEITKRYTYTKAVLGNKNPLNDAKDLAVQDFNELLRKTQEGEFINRDDVEIFATEKEVFSFRNKAKHRNELVQVSLQELLTKLVNTYMELKYEGPLNPESNPKLFVNEPAIKNEEGVVVCEETHYLHPQIEQDFHNTTDMYLKIINSCQ